MVASLVSPDAPRVNGVVLTIGFRALMKDEILLLEDRFISPLIGEEGKQKEVGDRLDSCIRQIIRIKEIVGAIASEIDKANLQASINDGIVEIDVSQHPLYPILLAHYPAFNKENAAMYFVPNVSLPENCTDMLIECVRILADSTSRIIRETGLEHRKTELCEMINEALTKIEKVSHATHETVQQAKEKLSEER